jgi:hypothetical protein
MTGMVAAYPVAPTRCCHCGRQKPHWTAGRVLEAFREFHAEHGRAPFRREWDKATISTPAAETVREMFGTWTAAVRAAGLEPPLASNTLRSWTRDEVIAAIFNWRYDTGDLPRSHEWAVQTCWRPSEKQVRRLFGSWNAAIEAAGYTPRRRFTTAATGTPLDGTHAGGRKEANDA